jgi:hypothetical protein
MTLASAPTNRLPASPAAANSRATRCPKTFDALLDWLKQVWADEPFPERIHSRGVFEMSRLGSPAENGQFAQHLYKPFAADDDNLYLTPLNAALCKMAAGTEWRPGMPQSAQGVWALIRNDFNWQAIAAENRWPAELYAHALNGIIDELKRLYNPRRMRGA